MRWCTNHNTRLAFRKEKQEKIVVILVVLTTPIFRFSFPISQLMAKAIPVRGAKFRKADVHWRLLSAFISTD
ncbi:hypothetical protein FRJ12_18430 [Salmonella enterica]|uniref:Uncharacterized protein n=2 Tax=Salmonella enterica TaxID=28901 RepID=A0A5U2PV98_SALER|nr:hypothetical protein [Salmonella enterica]EBD0187337.1 hypothetical protein [Salmonella enterica subsp. enterica serovar Schwarzengrund]EBD0550096.1 hypothetical protein [Salmonella enterica subsp. enterica]EBH8878381.1 hypothetical protein [Salmonella enterica subsp. houtenae serovar 53:z4,z23:-]EBI0169210.1 hypothetical protein [Salmonella enterica subsp. enterica serovar 4,5,12:b:-]ECS6440165.1 hypothetical protein [Salmonella enterica subsp. enterica serovar 4,[5],12:b:-]ECT9357438.1 h